MKIKTATDSEIRRVIAENETRANARLLAAAPELLRQRDELLEALSLVVNADYGSFEALKKANAACGEAGYWSKVESAIARATEGHEQKQTPTGEKEQK